MTPPSSLTVEIQVDADAAVAKIQRVTFYAEQASAAVDHLYAALDACKERSIGISVERVPPKPRRPWWVFWRKP